MRMFKPGLIAAAALFIGSGCVITSDSTTPDEEADLTILYTFGGRVLDSGAECSELGISTIEVEVNGVDVSDSTVKTESCTQFYQGITIKNLVVGNYDVTVTGRDSGGYALYQMSSPQRVSLGSGGAEIDVDAPSLFGSLTVYWTSFDGLTGSGRCQDAGVHDVRAVLYDSAGTIVHDDSMDCTYEGIVWDYLTAGTYEVVLNGLDSQDGILYAGEKEVVVNVGEDRAYDVDLHGLFGSLTVWWDSFAGHEGSHRCSQAGVSEVRATLYDSAGGLVSDDYYPCTQGGVEWDLEPGTYEIVLNGIDADGYVLYAGDAWVDVELGQNNVYEVDLVSMVGDLTIYWTFNDSTSCGSVDRVRVHLYDPWDDLYDEGSFDCTDTGVIYDNVEAGEWMVVLEGLNASGQIIYNNGGGDLLDVEAGVNNEYYVDLQ